MPTHFIIGKNHTAKVAASLQYNNQNPLSFENSYQVKIDSLGRIFDEPSRSFREEIRTGHYRLKREHYQASASLLKEAGPLFGALSLGASFPDLKLWQYGLVAGHGGSMGNFFSSVSVGGFVNRFESHATYLSHSPSHTDLEGAWMPDSSDGKENTLEFAAKAALLYRFNSDFSPYATLGMQSLDFRPSGTLVQKGSVVGGTSIEASSIISELECGLGLQVLQYKAFPLFLELTYHRQAAQARAREWFVSLTIQVNRTL